MKLKPTKVTVTEQLPVLKRGYVLIEDTAGNQFQVSESTYLRSFTDTKKFTKKKSNT